MKPPVVVLVGTSHPGNVGAIARGAANFGVEQLRFVGPRCDIKVGEAMARAKHAGHLLEGAEIFDDLESALADIGMAVGTTARTTKSEARHLRKTLDVRDWAEGLTETDVDVQVALVFGREDSGLTAEEVNRCDQLVTVPTSDYSSLNLAHAVSLLSYEHMRIRNTERITVARHLGGKTMQHLHKAWDDLIEQVETRPWRKAVSRGIFRKIIGRSHPDDHEVYNIMGIISGALRRFNHPDYRTEKSTRVLTKFGLLATPASDDEEE